jgi:class 3 adenylate cyclase
VAGYSRLTGADEEGTIARLRAMRDEVIDPGIAAHQGRIVKTMGDGFLAEFASVVDALRCAVALQRTLAEHNDRSGSRNLLLWGQVAQADHLALAVGFAKRLCEVGKTT